MQKSNLLKGGRFASRARIVAALTLVAAAGAMAIVGARHTGKVASHTAPRRGMERAGDDIMRPDPEDGGPYARALEDWAHRIYPLQDIPFETAERSASAWRAFEARQEYVTAVQPMTTFLFWRLAGPSIANMPGVLTFSAAPYTTGGRITALAISPTCSVSACRVWAAAAGGGVWRTDNALSNKPTWTYVSRSFATNAIGTLTYDAANNVLYAGTGEPNASADSEAGMGLYKSTDGGNTWTLVPAAVNNLTTNAPGTGSNGTYSGNAFLGRAISTVVVDPTNASHLYVSSVRSVRGISSTGGATSNPPTPRPPFGLFESTDGGATFKFIWDGSDQCPTTCDGTTTKASIRGVNKVQLDPSWNGTTNKIMYAGAFGGTGVAGSGGVWRSNDAGQTWTQIKTARNIGDSSDRAEFAVAALPAGKTRLYVGVGNGGNNTANQAHLYRTDDAAAATGDSSFTDLSAQQDASAAPNQTTGYCSSSAGGQCWYDNAVYSPPGKPDVVYLGGSYDYDNYGLRNQGRAFLRSTDGGVTFTDISWDATMTPTPAGSCCQNLPFAQNGMHPDSHAVIEVPGTNMAIFGSDGGLVRNSGIFTDISNTCTDVSRGPLTGANLATCQQLLKAVPTVLYSLNASLSTIQFQTVSVSPKDSTTIQGGTQDNGTFQTTNSEVWPQELFGDGGQSGFNAADPALRFATTTGKSAYGNFRNGDPTKWVVITGPLRTSSETALFYPPVIADPHPTAAGTIFMGAKSVWRTQDWGGPQSTLEANCNVFTVTGAALPTCGDVVAIGPAGATDLTTSTSPADYRGSTRTGGNVSQLARTTTDTTTLWAATTTGRVFVSKNADSATPATVTFTRIDTLSAAAPNRFVTGIYVDRANSNHAWISYNGYNFATPTTPGHIFSVTYDPVGATATWTPLDGTGDGAFPDFPATAIAVTADGDIFGANDFGVLRLPNGSTTWEVAGRNLPMVEVSGLTISPDGKKLYAATHGRSAWVADLPNTAPATPALTTQANPSTAVVGTAIRDTGTISSGVSPTGSITFQLYGPNDANCSSAPVFSSTVPINGNASYDSATFAPTQTGTYYWVATYSGDANNGVVATACADPAETVTVTTAPTPTATPTPVAKVTPTLTTQATSSITLGGSMSDTATLAGGNAPTGNITFKLYGPNDATCGAAAIFTSTVAVSGNGAYTSASFTPTQPGTYRWIASYSGDNANNAVANACNDSGEVSAVSPTPTPTPTATPTPTPTPTPAAQALNLSTRLFVGTGAAQGIEGFIVSAGGSKKVIIRGLGPSLPQSGQSMTGTLADPVLQLRAADGSLIASNDNWRDTQEAEVKATGIAPTYDVESAIVATLAPGNYTATLSGKGGTSGIGLVEVYDLDTAAASKLVNLSTRGNVLTNDQVMIGGFILGKSTGNESIIVRGLGPSLTARGVAGALADPALELRDRDGTLIRSNNDWKDDPAQSAAVSSAGVAPTDDRESAIAATLPPGNYTAVLAGRNGGTGIGLLEIYLR